MLSLSNSLLNTLQFPLLNAFSGVRIWEVLVSECGGLSFVWEAHCFNYKILARIEWMIPNKGSARPSILLNRLKIYFEKINEKWPFCVLGVLNIHSKTTVTFSKFHLLKA
jgi:hypothetical protein